MLSHPLTLSQSEESGGQEKPAMVPTPESPLAENSALRLSFARDLNSVLMLADDQNPASTLANNLNPDTKDPNLDLPLAELTPPELPLAEASTQTASISTSFTYSSSWSSVPSLPPYLIPPFLECSFGSSPRVLPPPLFPSCQPSPVSFPPSLTKVSSFPLLPPMSSVLASSSGSLPSSVFPSSCVTSNPFSHPSLVSSSVSSTPPSSALSSHLSSFPPSTLALTSVSLSPSSFHPFPIPLPPSFATSPVSSAPSASVSSSHLTAFPSSSPLLTSSLPSAVSKLPPTPLPPYRFPLPPTLPSASCPSVYAPSTTFPSSTFTSSHITLTSNPSSPLPSSPPSSLLIYISDSSSPSPVSLPPSPPSLSPPLTYSLPSETPSASSPSTHVSLPPIHPSVLSHSLTPKVSPTSSTLKNTFTVPSSPPSPASLVSSPNLLVSATSPASSVFPEMSPGSSSGSLPSQMSPQMSPSSSSPLSACPQIAPGPCVLCSSVLPRLLSSILSLHQKEIKLMIEGALVTVNKRLSALEQRLNELNKDSNGGQNEGEEPGPSQSGKRRRRREEKETRRKRRRHGDREETEGMDQTEQSFTAVDQSEQNVYAVARQNGLIAPLFRFSSLSHEPLGRCHGDLRATVMLWLSSPQGHTPIVRLPWKLSAAAVETAICLIVSEVSVSPERPLQDYTAPPYISSDHSYVRLSAPSLVISAWRQQQRYRTNHSSCRRPLPPVMTNGLAAPLTSAQSAASSDLILNKRDVKRVSQIRIRRASPKETNLTPLGLPKVKRLRKKDFSLEEIYTNKNYKAPSANSSSLETIFEEPREKNGALLLIGQQRRRRVLQFPDFTQPRKRKRPPTGVGLFTMAPRKRAAARRGYHDDCDSDVMLLQRLSALQDFLQRQGLDQDS